MVEWDGNHHSCEGVCWEMDNWRCKCHVRNGIGNANFCTDNHVWSWWNLGSHQPQSSKQRGGVSSKSNSCGRPNTAQKICLDRFQRPRNLPPILCVLVAKIYLYFGSSFDVIVFHLEDHWCSYFSSAGNRAGLWRQSAYCKHVALIYQNKRGISKSW